MTDQTTNEKKPKSRTIGSIDVSVLESVAEWKDFEAKAAVAKTANEAHEAAKEAMREVFKTKLKQAPAADIEFSKTGGKVIVTEILERPKPKRARASDMSSLFETETTETETTAKKGFGDRLRRT